MTESLELSIDQQQNGSKGGLINKDRMVHAYSYMKRARLLDEKAILLYKQNKCHFQIGCAGHEAVQVAAAECMKPGDDWACPYYRDMAFVLCWGMSNRDVLLGILNKADDPNSGGRQMPMHYGHKDLNILSQSSPTGTQYLQAVGLALAAKIRGENKVVYVSSGEGTTAQGSYHEAINWAAREKLPVVFVIQNNKFAISVPVSNQIAGGDVASISSGYQDLDSVKVDGLDYLKSYKTLSRAINRARIGEGPTVVVAEVVRLQSHSISDNQAKYRSNEEIEEDKNHDPLRIMAEFMEQEGILSSDEIEELNISLREDIDRDAEWAEAQVDPHPSSFSAHVMKNPSPAEGVPEPEVTGEAVYMVDSLNHALDEELSRNPEMIVYGQDVAGGKGGVFSVTSGLTAKHSESRVFNSPLAEASIVGTAVGMAAAGIKPVVEIQFGDYIWTAMMQIRNEMAMLHYRSNGFFSCPMVVRVAVGGYIRGALYHSQNIEGTFTHFPGLTVIYPSNATDAKGLLKSAIRSPDPVLFLEHKGLYRQPYAKGPEGDAETLTPIAKAKIVREGQDATIITYGALVNKSLNAAKTVMDMGYSIEVIDLRTLLPVDYNCILQSIKKTSRLLIAQEDVLFMGYGAEIAAYIAQFAFEYLDAPIIRVAGKNCPVPHAPILEDTVLPQDDDVLDGLLQLLEY